MRLYKDFQEFNKGKSTIQKFSTLICNPCFHSVCLYRLSNLLYRIKLSPLAKLVWYINRLVFNVDIDYRADLAGGFFLVHGLGTVIGHNVISKGRLTVYQGVTLGGGNGKPGRLDSDGIIRGMPCFEDNCIVYTGAIVVGGVTISKNTIIKARELVSSDR